MKVWSGVLAGCQVESLASGCDRLSDGIRVAIEAQVESEWLQALTDCQVV